MHAEKCPICNGKGKIKKDDFKPLIDSEICHGCNGRGWVEVQDSAIPYIPYYPQPQPYMPSPYPYIDPGPWTEPYYYTPNTADAPKPQNERVWC